MVHAIEDVVDRSQIVFMTMFDYDPRSPRCRWDAPLDWTGRTGNDAIRDEASELGIRVIDMNGIMDAAADYLRKRAGAGPSAPTAFTPTSTATSSWLWRSSANWWAPDRRLEARSSLPSFFASRSGGRRGDRVGLHPRPR